MSFDDLLQINFSFMDFNCIYIDHLAMLFLVDLILTNGDKRSPLCFVFNRARISNSTAITNCMALCFLDQVSDAANTSH